MTDTSSALPTQITIALQNASVSALHASIEANTPIAYKQSETNLWGSTTQSGKTIISYADCKYPAEAFAHELLHAELKLNGYIQYATYVVKAPCPHRSAVEALLCILDNELQHHRMVNRFLELRLDPKRFYNDRDVNSFKKVRRAVERMNDRNTVAEFFTQLVTVIAPGGTQTETERNQLRNYLMDHAGRKNKKRLEDIEAHFADWRNSSSLDAAPAIQRILQSIELDCSYWVGASMNFPDDGLFVGAPFRVDEAERA